MMHAVEFKRLLDSLLKPMGFVRGSGCWIRKENGLVTVLSLDKQPYGPWYSIDIGAELEHRNYSNKESAVCFDIIDIFVFPADSNDMESYKTIEHVITVADKAFARSYVNLDNFTEQEARDVLNFNIENRLVPLLNIESLKTRVNEDIYLVVSGRACHLHRYGVPEDLIARYSLRKK